MGANRFTTFRPCVAAGPRVLQSWFAGGNDVRVGNGEIRLGDFYRVRCVRWFSETSAADYCGQVVSVRRAGADSLLWRCLCLLGFVCDSVCAERDAVGVGQAFGRGGLRSSEIPVTVIPAQAGNPLVNFGCLIYFLFSCCPCGGFPPARE